MDVAAALSQSRSLFEQVIQELDPARLVRHYLRFDSERLVVSDEPLELSPQSRLVVIALGKAAPKMMEGAIGALGPRIDEALIITKAGVPIPEAVTRSGRPLIFGGHPIPNDDSIRAGEAAFHLAERLGRDDVLLMLISGGGSALMELPVEGLTLEDVQTTTDLILRQGADINQLNAVRHRLSRIKGGGLASAASPARIVNLIVSDVLGSPLPVIASGPTVVFDPKLDRGIDALKDSPVWNNLPDAVRAKLAEGSTAGSEAQGHAIRSIVIADSRTAAESAARSAREIGYASEVLGAEFSGEARDFAADWVEHARTARDAGDTARPRCLVGAGELTVTVQGSGSGGRNSEMALAAARLIDGDERLAIASLATDGDDGTTGAAGGVVTGESCRIAQVAGLDPSSLLDQNDSQTFLDATGGTLRTGLTGTNVCDLYLAFIDGPPGSDAGEWREDGDVSGVQA